MPANHARKWSDQWTAEQRQLAHKLVAEAKKSGELTRQPCEVCGAPYALAHHENYDQPLAVEWLCSRHHVRRHLELDPSIVVRSQEARARNHAQRAGKAEPLFEPLSTSRPATANTRKARRGSSPRRRLISRTASRNSAFDMEAT